MEFREGVTLGTNRVFNPPFMNGAGCCKTVEDVCKLSRSLAGAIVLGSFTKEERPVNPGNVWWVGPHGEALNSLGMPNGGESYLDAHLPEMVQIAHDAGKVFVVNVAEFTPSGYAELAATALKGGADAVELNLGCPNVVHGDGSRKPIPSYDPDITGEIISVVQKEVGRNTPVWIKVSPLEPELLKKCAAVIAEDPIVKAVTAINTVPCAYGMDKNGKSVIGVGLA